MDTNRRIAVITGAVFIVATVASLLATAITPALTGTDYLARFAAQPNQVSGGALLYLVSSFASVGIALALYPVLKERHAGLALGSVVFRTLEGAFYLIEVVCLLSRLTLGRRFAAAGAADQAALHAIGDALVSVRSHAALLAVFAFCLGALMYYYLFFQSRLVPRWLSGWGIGGIVLMLAACMLSLFNDSPITANVPLVIPIFLQEMVLAIWLIVKGFNPPALMPAPAPRLPAEARARHAHEDSGRLHRPKNANGPPASVNRKKSSRPIHRRSRWSKYSRTRRTATESDSFSLATIPMFLKAGTSSSLTMIW